METTYREHLIAGKEQFKTNGYWKSPRIFSEQELATYIVHINMILTGTYEKGTPPQRDNKVRSGGVRKITNAWWADYVVETIALNPAVAEAAAILLECEELYLWKDHVILKPSKSGSEGNVGWHQDRPYWDESSSEKMITATVALGPINESNGCLRFIPGSHVLGVVDGSDFYDTDIDAQIKRFETSLSAQQVKEAPLILEAGEVGFHHSMILHSSGPNVSEIPRNVLALHYVDGEATLIKDKEDENYREVYRINIGERFRGPKFPRVWPA